MARHRLGAWGESQVPKAAKQRVIWLLQEQPVVRYKMP